MFAKMQRGSSVIDVVIGAAIIVFVILPVFSITAEKYILRNKVQIIKDALDMANISVYNALKTDILACAAVDFDYSEAEEIYRVLLSENLQLNEDLSPMQHSVAEGSVVIESLIFYTEVLPAVCPGGLTITRPSVHSCVCVPVKPSLYRQVVLRILGKSVLELKIHVDSEIPLNN